MFLVFPLSAILYTDYSQLEEYPASNGAREGALLVEHFLGISTNSFRSVGLSKLGSGKYIEFEGFCRVDDALI